MKIGLQCYARLCRSSRVKCKENLERVKFKIDVKLLQFRLICENKKNQRTIFRLRKQWRISNVISLILNNNKNYESCRESVTVVDDLILIYWTPHIVVVPTCNFHENLFNGVTIFSCGAVKQFRHQMEMPSD
jgi:hypothetical protein